VDRGVRADLDRGVDQRARRIDDRHAGALVRLVDAPLGEAGHVREVHTVVDAEREIDLGERVGLDEASRRRQDGQHAGQVQLALGVVGVELGQRGQQLAALEQVEAGVDLPDRELLRGRVAGGLRLGHALDRAGGVAHHASVAGGVIELHAGDRRGRARVLVGADELGDRRAGDQRHVAVDDEHRRRAVDQLGGGQHRVTGPARLVLDRDLDVGGQVLAQHPLRVVDDDHALRTGGTRREQRPEDHRAPADRVQDLGQRGAHPGPLTRGEDDHGRGGHELPS
jgi:hypothetical protein